MQGAFRVPDEPVQISSIVRVEKKHRMEGSTVLELVGESGDSFVVSDPHTVPAEVDAGFPRVPFKKFDADDTHLGLHDVAFTKAQNLVRFEGFLATEESPGPFIFPMDFQRLAECGVIENLRDRVFPRPQVFHLHLELLFFDRLEEAARRRFRHHVPERVFFPEVIECGDHDHRAVPVGLAYVLEVVCDQRWYGLPFRIIVQLAVLAVLEPENKEAVASAKMGGFTRSSVRCEHGMPGADSAAVVCHAAVEYVAQVRCRDGDGMAVAIGACRVAVLCTDAVAEDGIHAAFVEADPVVENRKNVLCLLGQRTLDRIDNKLSLSCQLATRQSLVRFDRTFESFAVTADSGDCLGVLPSESEAYEGSPFVGFAGGIEGVLDELADHGSRPQVGEGGDAGGCEANAASLSECEIEAFAHDDISFCSR